MKSTFTAIALASALTLPAQETFTDGSRYDYFNKAGERLESVNIGPFTAVMNSVANPDGGFTVNSPMGNEFFSMKRIPWGTESYDFQISTDPQEAEEPGLKEATVGGFEIIEEGENAPLRAMRADASGLDFNLKCGTTFRFYVDVPEGTTPYIAQFLELTKTYNHGGAMWIDQIENMRQGMSAFNWRLNHRKYVYESLDKIEWFEADPSVPNRYWITMMMPNEPMHLVIAAQHPESTLLEHAIEGVWNSTYTGAMDGYSVQGMFDECNLMYFLSEGMGPDAYLPIFTSVNAWSMLWRMDIDSPQYVWSPWVWDYARLLIERANHLLDLLPRFEGHCQAQEIDNARAAMLTLRSHAYLRLLQFMAPRWEDSNSGEAKCAPLRTEFNLDGVPLASMNDILDRCYADLNQAIGIFEANSYTKSALADPDAALAHGTLARLALIKHDWATARTHAAAARAGKPLTSNEECLAGFNTPTDSWIWGNGHAYYYANHATAISCNGYHTQHIGGSRINFDLYNRLNESDIRRTTFVTHENFPVVRDKKYWFKSPYIADDLSVSNTAMQTALREKLEEMNAAQATGTVPSFLTENYSPINSIFVGMQTKFWMKGLDLDEATCDKAVFMRTDEMLLIEAEAALMLGDLTAAQSLLGELNRMRIGADYSAPSTVEELLEELRLTRRIELWGEGFGWTDFKRWNLPMERKAWIADDIYSGSYPDTHTIPTSKCNGWRIPVPSTATQYNDKIDISELNYTGISYDEPSNAPAPSTPAPQPASRVARQLLPPNHSYQTK